MKFRHILEVSVCKFHRKTSGCIFIIYGFKMKLCAVKFRCISEVLRLQGFQKSSGHIFKKFASRNEAVGCRVQTQFGSFSLASFVKKILGAFSRFMRPKMKMFPVKFRCVLEVFALQGL